MFNKNSIVVKAWVNKITGGDNTRDQVPALSNLRDIVFQILGPEE